MRRSKPLQRGRRKREPVDLALEKRYWRAAVIRDGCVMCRACPAPPLIRHQRPLDFRRIEGHHVLAKRHLRTHRLEHRFWDTRNGLALCTWHHQRHEAGMQRVPYELVPDDALEFAVELDLEWIIEREYPRA